MSIVAVDECDRQSQASVLQVNIQKGELDISLLTVFQGCKLTFCMRACLSDYQKIVVVVNILMRICLLHA